MIIVTDLSDRYPNVFCEAGITTTLGRELIPIAQKLAHIPFDLQGIRALTHLPNGVGLDQPRTRLEMKLRSFAASGCDPALNRGSDRVEHDNATWVRTIAGRVGGE